MKQNNKINACEPTIHLIRTFSAPLQLPAASLQPPPYLFPRSPHNNEPLSHSLTFPYSLPTHMHIPKQ